MTIEKDFIRGFNDGYVLGKHTQLHSKDFNIILPTSSYNEGLVDGLKEIEKDLELNRNLELNRIRKSKSKSRTFER